MELEDKGGEYLRRKLADPEYATAIADIREGMREMDRALNSHAYLSDSAAKREFRKHRFPPALNPPRKDQMRPRFNQQFSVQETLQVFGVHRLV
ncbi:hypothetical protein [[Mycobacterium] vasticus]|uniref:Uncharacterized protein n=1 Tax=[Mycobacterium] vasticus TaxID=2875777 RepID=A0ABU5Z3H9_9MYCO|nr:hypothetical protein [Mycolicibacter sp. MYC017]MEB3071965.1 hypothetical protein [Mycolicibacter sp. MYC017]